MRNVEFEEILATVGQDMTQGTRIELLVNHPQIAKGRFQQATIVDGVAFVASDANVAYEEGEYRVCTVH